MADKPKAEKERKLEKFADFLKDISHLICPPDLECIDDSVEACGKCYARYLTEHKEGFGLWTIDEAIEVVKEFKKWYGVEIFITKPDDDDLKAVHELMKSRGKNLDCLTANYANWTCDNIIRQFEKMKAEENEL